MYRLYYYPGNASLAPHMALQEIGAPFELVLVDRSRNAQKDPAYLRLNPLGRIPTLTDGDLVLFESAAICLHLADRHPEADLAPPLGTPERSHFYKWLVHLTNTLQTELLVYHYPGRHTDDPAGVPAVKAAAERRIGDMLAVLDGALAAGGPWLLGPRYSIADGYLLMLCRWTRNMARPARDYPALGPFLRRALERPAIARAFAAEGVPQPYV